MKNGDRTGLESVPASGSVRAGSIEPPASPSPTRRALEIAFLVLLGTVALGLRLWPLQIAHWWDETAYLQNAEALFFGKSNYSELDSRPPLLSVLFGMAFSIWHNVFAASIVVAVLNAMGVLFLAAAGRALYGRAEGAVAGLFMGLSPFSAET